MNPTVEVHPQKEQLAAFGLGRLTAEESVWIEKHLDHCDECNQTLISLDDDTFAGVVRSLADSPAAQHNFEPAPNRETDVSQVPRAEQTVGAVAGRETNTGQATQLLRGGDPQSPIELRDELKSHPRYRVLELAGRGGMGDVYRAEHMLMHRPVALKLINAQLMSHPQAVERFRREVRAAAKLSHPNIVTAHDAEQAGSLHFLAMEFVDGTDLASVVRSHGPLQVSVACEYIRQAATGLQHACEKGMVHRDIKPHNLMVTDSGVVKILDFGLASFVSEAAIAGSPVASQHHSDDLEEASSNIDSAQPDEHDSNDQQTCRGAAGRQDASVAYLTSPGSVMGTPDYIAPEQAVDAHSSDIRADIYSLGCTLHFLLTGNPPFEGKTVIEKLKAHADQSLPSLTSVRNDVPLALASVAARMMAKDPADRFQTPAEVAAALAPFSKPATTPPRRRTAMRNVLVAAAAMLLASVIYVTTDKGRIEIRTEVDDVEVVVSQGGEEVRTIDLATGSQIKWMPSGDYTISLKQDRNDIQITPGGFALSRWGRQIVSVSRLRATAVATNDQDQIQGIWIPESCLMRGKPLSAGQLSRMAIELSGDRATFTDPDSGFQQTGRFSIDATRTPKHIEFIAPDASERMPGIFEFDGERLRLAWCDGDYARPTSFEPADTPDHMTAVFRRVPGSIRATAPQDPPAGPFVPDESQREAVKAAEAYLAVMDEGTFGELRDMVSSLARPHVTREQVSQTYQKLRDTFGKATQRTLTRVQLYGEFPSLPKGRYALVQFKTDCERQKGLWESLLVNVDADGQWRVNTYALTLEPMPFPETKPDPAIEQKKQAALIAAQEWLKLIDAGQYAESWQASARINRDGITEQKMVDAYNELFKPLGQLKSREHTSSEYRTQMPRAPVGEYAVIQFRTWFITQRVIETVVLARETDGQWRVSGYFHAKDQSTPSDTATTTPDPFLPKDGTTRLQVIPAEANENEPPQQRPGLLTSPPKLPPGGLPVGKNLIVDPSLEDTATGGLPQGWLGWLNDGPNFKCEVVEGGVTGKHCLQISGTGTRGVVFATSIPLDRTKRFALKGRLKVEGEAETWAVIKLNYFNNTGWLGVDDRVGVTTADLDWKLLEKTDLADKYPAATLIVPTCHIEGNGTAWFDDLQVIAYDRESLTADFDATQGRNNRMK